MSLNNSVNQEGRKSPKRGRSALAAALRRPLASFLHSVSVNFTSHSAPQRTLRRHFSAGFSLLTIALLFFAVGALSADSRRESQTPGGFLYSQYLQEAGYAASGSDQISVGTFAVNIPHSFLLMDGRRIAERVGNAIDALPLQHWLMDYYLEEDADISSQWVHQAARTGWDIAGQATDEAVLILTEPAREIGFVNNIEVDLQSELGGRFSQAALNAVGAVRESVSDVLAWQLRGYFGRDDDSGGRQGLNAGLIYRRAVQNDTALWGVNTFLDYETYEEEQFWRWSGGAEYRTAYANAYANYYLGISDPVFSVNEDNENIATYTADGYEIGVNVRIPNVSWLSLVGEYYAWEGQYGREDDSGFRSGVRFHPLSMPFSAEILFQDGEDGESVGGQISFLLWHEIGRPPSARRTDPGDFRPQDWFYTPVRREHSQRIYETSIEPGGSPFSVLGLSPAGSTISVGVASAPGGNDRRTSLVAVDLGNVDPPGVLLNGVLEGVTLPASTRRAYPWRLPAGSVTVYTQSSASGQSAVTLTYEQGGNSGTLEIFSTVVLLPNAQPLLLHGKVSVAAESGEIVIRTPEREVRVPGVGRGGGASVILERTNVNAQEIYTPVPNPAADVRITLVEIGDADFQINAISIAVDNEGNPEVASTMSMLASKLETPVMDVNTAYDDEDLFGDSVDISQDGNRIRITYLETTDLSQRNEPIATFRARGGSDSRTFLPLSVGVSGFSFDTGSGELRLDHANDRFPDEDVTVLITATVVARDTALDIEQEISLVFTVEVAGLPLEQLEASFVGAANNSSASNPYRVTGFFLAGTEANVIATAQVTAGTGVGYNYAIPGTDVNTNIELNTANGEIVLGPVRDNPNAQNNYASGDVFTVTVIANDGNDPDGRTDAQQLVLYLSVATVDYPPVGRNIASSLPGDGLTSATALTVSRSDQALATVTAGGGAGGEPGSTDYQFELVGSNEFSLQIVTGGANANQAILHFANGVLPRTSRVFQAQVRITEPTSGLSDTLPVYFDVEAPDPIAGVWAVNASYPTYGDSFDSPSPLQLELSYSVVEAPATSPHFAALSFTGGSGAAQISTPETDDISAELAHSNGNISFGSSAFVGTVAVTARWTVEVTITDTQIGQTIVAQFAVNVEGEPVTPIQPSFIGISPSQGSPHSARGSFTEAVAVATLTTDGGIGNISYAVESADAGLVLENNIIRLAQRTANDPRFVNLLTMAVRVSDANTATADNGEEFTPDQFITLFVQITDTDYPDLNVGHVVGGSRLTGTGTSTDPYVSGRRRSDIAILTPSGGSNVYRYSILPENNGIFAVGSAAGASTNLRFFDSQLPVPQEQVYTATIQVESLVNGTQVIDRHTEVIYVSVSTAPPVGAELVPNSDYDANSEDTNSARANGGRVVVSYREDRGADTTVPIASVALQPEIGALIFNAATNVPDGFDLVLESGQDQNEDWKLYLTAPIIEAPGQYLFTISAMVNSDPTATPPLPTSDYGPAELEVELDVLPVTQVSAELQGGVTDTAEGEGTQAEPYLVRGASGDNAGPDRLLIADVAQVSKGYFELESDSSARNLAVSAEHTGGLLAYENGQVFLTNDRSVLQRGLTAITLTFSDSAAPQHGAPRTDGSDRTPDFALTLFINVIAIAYDSIELERESGDAVEAGGNGSPETPWQTNRNSGSLARFGVSGGGSGRFVVATGSDHFEVSQADTSSYGVLRWSNGLPAESQDNGETIDTYLATITVYSVYRDNDSDPVEQAGNFVYMTVFTVHVDALEAPDVRASIIGNFNYQNQQSVIERDGRLIQITHREDQLLNTATHIASVTLYPPGNDTELRSVDASNRWRLSSNTDLRIFLSVASPSFDFPDVPGTNEYPATLHIFEPDALGTNGTPIPDEIVVRIVTEPVPPISVLLVDADGNEVSGQTGLIASDPLVVTGNFANNANVISFNQVSRGLLPDNRNLLVAISGTLPGGSPLNLVSPELIPSGSVAIALNTNPTPGTAVHAITLTFSDNHSSAVAGGAGVNRRDGTDRTEALTRTLFVRIDDVNYPELTFTHGPALARQGTGADSNLYTTSRAGSVVRFVAAGGGNVYRFAHSGNATDFEIVQGEGSDAHTAELRLLRNLGNGNELAVTITVFAVDPLNTDANAAPLEMDTVVLRIGGDSDAEFGVVMFASGTGTETAPRTNRAVALQYSDSATDGYLDIGEQGSIVYSVDTRAFPSHPALSVPVTRLSAVLGVSGGQPASNIRVAVIGIDQNNLITVNSAQGGFGTFVSDEIPVHFVAVPTAAITTTIRITTEVLYNLGSVSDLRGRDVSEIVLEIQGVNPLAAAWADGASSTSDDPLDTIPSHFVNSVAVATVSVSSFGFQADGNGIRYDIISPAAPILPLVVERDNNQPVVEIEDGTPLLAVRFPPNADPNLTYGLSVIVSDRGTSGTDDRDGTTDFTPEVTLSFYASPLSVQYPAIGGTFEGATGGDGEAGNNPIVIPNVLAAGEAFLTINLNGGDNTYEVEGFYGAETGGAATIDYAHTSPSSEVVLSFNQPVRTDGDYVFNLTVTSAAGDQGVINGYAQTDIPFALHVLSSLDTENDAFGVIHKAQQKVTLDQFDGPLVTIQAVGADVGDIHTFTFTPDQPGLAIVSEADDSAAGTSNRGVITFANPAGITSSERFAATVDVIAGADRRQVIVRISASVQMLAIRTEPRRFYFTNWEIENLGNNRGASAEDYPDEDFALPRVTLELTGEDFAATDTITFTRTSCESTSPEAVCGGNTATDTGAPLFADPIDAGIAQVAVPFAQGSGSFLGSTNDAKRRLIATVVFRGERTADESASGTIAMEVISVQAFAPGDDGAAIEPGENLGQPGHRDHAYPLQISLLGVSLTGPQINTYGQTSHSVLRIYDHTHASTNQPVNNLVLSPNTNGVGIVSRTISGGDNVYDISYNGALNIPDPINFESGGIRYGEVNVEIEADRGETTAGVRPAIIQAQLQIPYCLRTFTPALNDSNQPRSFVDEFSTRQQVYLHRGGAHHRMNFFFGSTGSDFNGTFNAGGIVQLSRANAGGEVVSILPAGQGGRDELAAVVENVYRLYVTDTDILLLEEDGEETVECTYDDQAGAGRFFMDGDGELVSELSSGTGSVKTRFETPVVGTVNELVFDRVITGLTTGDGTTPETAYVVSAPSGSQVQANVAQATVVYNGGLGSFRRFEKVGTEGGLQVDEFTGVISFINNVGINSDVAITIRTSSATAAPKERTFYFRTQVAIGDTIESALEGEGTEGMPLQAGPDQVATGAVIATVRGLGGDGNYTYERQGASGLVIDENTGVITFDSSSALNFGINALYTITVHSLSNSEMIDRVVYVQLVIPVIASVAGNPQARGNGAQTSPYVLTDQQFAANTGFLTVSAQGGSGGPYHVAVEGSAGFIDQFGISNIGAGISSFTISFRSERPDSALHSVQVTFNDDIEGGLTVGDVRAISSYTVHISTGLLFRNVTSALTGDGNPASPYVVEGGNLASGTALATILYNDDDTTSFSIQRLAGSSPDLQVSSGGVISYVSSPTVHATTHILIRAQRNANERTEQREVVFRSVVPVSLAFNKAGNINGDGTQGSPLVLGLDSNEFLGELRRRGGHHAASPAYVYGEVDGPSDVLRINRDDLLVKPDNPGLMFNTLATITAMISRQGDPETALLTVFATTFIPVGHIRTESQYATLALNGLTPEYPLVIFNPVADLANEEFATVHMRGGDGIYQTSFSGSGGPTQNVREGRVVGQLGVYTVSFRDQTNLLSNSNLVNADLSLTIQFTDTNIPTGTNGRSFDHELYFRIVNDVALSATPSRVYRSTPEYPVVSNANDVLSDLDLTNAIPDSDFVIASCGDRRAGETAPVADRHFCGGGTPSSAAAELAGTSGTTDNRQILWRAGLGHTAASYDSNPFEGVIEVEAQKVYGTGANLVTVPYATLAATLDVVGMSFAPLHTSGGVAGSPRYVLPDAAMVTMTGAAISYSDNIATATPFGAIASASDYVMELADETDGLSMDNAGVISYNYSSGDFPESVGGTIRIKRSGENDLPVAAQAKVEFTADIPRCVRVFRHGEIRGHTSGNPLYAGTTGDSIADTGFTFNYYQHDGNTRTLANDPGTPGGATDSDYGKVYSIVRSDHPNQALAASFSENFYRLVRLVDGTGFRAGFVAVEGDPSSIVCRSSTAGLQSGEFFVNAQWQETTNFSNDLAPVYPAAVRIEDPVPALTVNNAANLVASSGATGEGTAASHLNLPASLLGADAVLASLSPTGGDGLYQYDKVGSGGVLGVTNDGEVELTLAINTAPSSHTITVQIRSAGLASNARVTASLTVHVTVDSIPLRATVVLLDGVALENEGGDVIGDGLSSTTRFFTTLSGVQNIAQMQASGGNGTYTYTAEGIASNLEVNGNGLIQSKSTFSAGTGNRVLAGIITVRVQSAGETARVTLYINAVRKVDATFAGALNAVKSGSGNGKTSATPFVVDTNDASTHLVTITRAAGFCNDEPCRFSILEPESSKFTVAPVSATDKDHGVLTFKSENTGNGSYTATVEVRSDKTSHGFEDQLADTVTVYIDLELPPVIIAPAVAVGNRIGNGASDSTPFVVSITEQSGAVIARYSVTALDESGTAVDENVTLTYSQFGTTVGQLLRFEENSARVGELKLAASPEDERGTNHTITLQVAVKDDNTKFARRVVHVSVPYPPVVADLVQLVQGTGDRASSSNPLTLSSPIATNVALFRVESIMGGAGNDGGLDGYYIRLFGGFTNPVDRFTVGMNREIFFKEPIPASSDTLFAQLYVISPKPGTMPSQNMQVGEFITNINIQALGGVFNPEDFVVVTVAAAGIQGTGERDTPYVITRPIGLTGPTNPAVRLAGRLDNVAVQGTAALGGTNSNITVDASGAVYFTDANLAAGDYQVRYTYTYGIGFAETSDIHFRVEAPALAPLTATFVTGADVLGGDGTENNPYQYTRNGAVLAMVVPSGGDGNYVVQTLSGLSNRYLINSPGNNVFRLEHATESGFPQDGVRDQVIVQVTDGSGNSYTQTVYASAPLTATHVPSGSTTGEGIDQIPYVIANAGDAVAQITPAGGVADYTYEIINPTNPVSYAVNADGLLSHTGAALPTEKMTVTVRVTDSASGTHDEEIVVEAAEQPVQGNIVMSGPSTGIQQFRLATHDTYPSRYRVSGDTYLAQYNSLSDPNLAETNTNLFVTFKVPEWDTAGLDYTMEAVQIVHPDGLPVTENQFTLTLLTDDRYRLLYNKEEFYRFLRVEESGGVFGGSATAYGDDDETCHRAVVVARTAGQQPISLSVRFHPDGGGLGSNLLICDEENEDGISYRDVTATRTVNNSPMMTGTGTENDPFVFPNGLPAAGFSMVTYVVQGGNHNQTNPATNDDRRNGSRYIGGISRTSPSVGNFGVDRYFALVRESGTGRTWQERELQLAGSDLGDLVTNAGGTKIRIDIIMDDRQTFNSEYRDSVYVQVPNN